MRKVKYRGKAHYRKGKSKWIFGFYYEIFGSPYILPDGEDREPSQIVDRESVGQFIDRIDKNGAEVYEGDIICYSDLDSDGEYFYDYFVVEFVDDFEDGKLGFTCHSIKNLACCFDMFSKEEFAAHIEVIGNRYDNPGMLKKLKKVNAA